MTKTELKDEILAIKALVETQKGKFFENKENVTRLNDAFSEFDTLNIDTKPYVWYENLDEYDNNRRFYEIYNLYADSGTYTDIVELSENPTEDGVKLQATPLVNLTEEDDISDVITFLDRLLNLLQE